MDRTSLEGITLDRFDRGAAGSTAVVTIDHARKANALDSTILGSLAAAFGALAADASLRAVVLTGAGERSFIAGADLAEMRGLDREGARRFIGRVHGACAAIRALPVPVIARVNGACFGAGVEIAAACDFRIAADHARFGMPEVRVGIPSVVEAALLPGLIGWGHTRWLLLTGETIDAARALAWGLVEDVVPAAGLDAAIERPLAAILESGPNAIRIQKRLVSDWERLALTAGITAGVDAFASAWNTDEPASYLGAALDRLARRDPP